VVFPPVPKRETDLHTTFLMIASKSFTIPTEGSMLGVIASVLTLGTLTLVKRSVWASLARN